MIPFIAEFRVQSAHHNLKEPRAPWKKSYDKSRQYIKKQRHYFADKDPYSQSYGFSSSHVQMWELDCKQDWAPKNWCFQIVVLEKTLWGSLGLQGDPTSQSWRKLILNIHWKDRCWSWNSSALATWCEELTHWKRLMLGKIEGRRRSGRQKMRWLNGITDSWTWVWASTKRCWRTVSLVCCSP